METPHPFLHIHGTLHRSERAKYPQKLFTHTGNGYTELLLPNDRDRRKKLAGIRHLADCRPAVLLELWL